MKFEKWQIPTVSTEAVRRLTEAGYPYLVSAVLVSRGITTAADAAAFLAQEHSLIYDPRLMRDMSRAVGRISRALADGERMAVFGDYDVDGITATVILVDYLKNRGADCLHYIPRRIEERVRPVLRRHCRAAQEGCEPAHHGRLRHHRRGGGRLRQVPRHGRGHHRPPRVQGDAAGRGRRR